MSVELTQEYLKECLDYDDETGVLTWLERPLEHFKNAQAWKAWNTRCVGKEAGSLDRRGGGSGRMYRQLRIHNRRYISHRIIWLWRYGVWPENHIDHINGDGLDNRLVNIRDVPNVENRKNMPKSLNNTSGVTGIFFREAKDKWVAQIGVEGVTRHLGYFTDKFEAICARKSAEVQHGFHTNHGR